MLVSRNTRSLVRPATGHADFRSRRQSGYQFGCAQGAWGVSACAISVRVRTWPDSGLWRSTGDHVLAADQPTGARSLTIRRLLVRASSRSIATAISPGGDSVDHRLPTRRSSPRRSSFCTRASVLSWLRPDARAAIAVENEPDIAPSAARRRSGRWSVRPECGFDDERGSTGTVERVPARTRACVRPVDPPRSAPGSHRTRQLARARPGGRSRTAAIHDQSRRRRSGVRRALLRSGPRYASTFPSHDRTSSAPSQSTFGTETCSSSARPSSKPCRACGWRMGDRTRSSPHSRYWAADTQRVSPSRTASVGRRPTRRATPSDASWPGRM